MVTLAFYDIISGVCSYDQLFSWAEDTVARPTPGKLHIVLSHKRVLDDEINYACLMQRPFFNKISRPCNEGYVEFL